jgi:uncharacterized repeat protein (TIGR03803 family)
MKRIGNAAGKLNWGTRAYAVFVLCATTAIALPAQTLTTLHSFDLTDGSQLQVGLVQATNGALYGTTLVNANSVSTVFRITASGALTTVHNFDNTDGFLPYGALVQATNGNFYGTTEVGGAGNGTVFKMTPGGTLTTLHTFAGADGEYPYGALVQATNGSFYGVTDGGGTNYGTVFKITPSGTLTTIHIFDGTDGSGPLGGLIQATDGNFYGTTSGGGANSFGTVFKMTPGGTLRTLHSFDGTDGISPYAGLVQGTDGNFYGTTLNGGVNSGGAAAGGTVFQITPSGTLTTLHSFCYLEGQCIDGGSPIAGLVQGTDGNFYGTTISGGVGTDPQGTVFKITSSGTLTTLYTFCPQGPSVGLCTAGAYPEAALVQDTNGKFYGTTDVGGAYNYGTVFSLSVGLGPFVETQTTSGKVGAPVKILGTNLTGASSVGFNGTAAVFTVVSSSEITTTVPAGASTGKVEVVTPTRTLSSYVSFRVLP